MVERSPIRALSVTAAELTRGTMHDGIELVFVHKGTLPMTLETGQLELTEGQAALLWAAIPRVFDPGSGSLLTTVEIALDSFLGWRLPIALNAALLSGMACRGLTGDIEGMAVLKWEDDLAADDPFVRRAAELEIQACVLRMARRSAEATSRRADASDWRRAVEFILEHLDEDLSIAEVAGAVGRHPGHLMRIFRQRTGFTIGAFILRHRLARAKRLLISTSLPIGEVAYRAGFGSERRFFEAFRTSVGASPLAYRRQFADRTAP